MLAGVELNGRKVWIDWDLHHWSVGNEGDRVAFEAACARQLRDETVAWYPPVSQPGTPRPSGSTEDSRCDRCGRRSPIRPCRDCTEEKW